MIIRSAFASIAVLLLITGMALAQQPVNERLGRLEERLETIQQNQEAILDRFGEMGRRLEGLEQKVGSRGGSGSEVAAIAEIARQTMVSYESNFSLIRNVIIGASALVTLILGGFAILGYRQIADVTRRVEEERRKISSLEERSKTTIEVLELHASQAPVNIKALPHVVYAFLLVQTSEDPGALRQALRDVEKVIDDIKPTEPKILGWAYSIQGYLLRRFIDPRRALESIERSLKLDPDNALTWYNAACYAVLEREREKWVHYLGETFRLSPDYRQDAIEDTDFSSVRDDPEFRKLTGQASYQSTS